MKKINRNVFSETFYECDKHIANITVANTHLKSIMPLSADDYSVLDAVTMSFIDQLIYRFSKLQDTMGEKIFSLILLSVEENISNKTFLDILNRLEELEVVDKDEWLLLREIRNNIAHEYSFNADEVVDNINLIVDKSQLLINRYQKIYQFCRTKSLI